MNTKHNRHAAGIAAGVLLASLGLQTAPTSASQIVSAASAEYGIIEGIAVREGSADPIADIQITVNGNSGILTDLLGPGATPEQSKELAQSIVDAARRGMQVPTEILIEAQQAVQGNPADARRKSAPLTATTDSSGHFRIENVSPGTATVRAQLTGYFAPGVNGTYAPKVEQKVEVEARKTTEIRMQMVPGGTISGRVYSAVGKPLQGMSIQVLRSGYSDGQVSMQFVDLKTTDDRGEFRSSRIPPGDYYVLANPQQNSSNVRTAATEVFISTLYPDALDVAAAQPASLRADDDLTNINIKVRSAAAAKISGRVVTSLPPGPVTGQRGQTRQSTAALAIMARNALGSVEVEGVVLGPPKITANPEDGTFEIWNVPPGTYDIFARLPVPANAGWGTSFPPARATSPWVIGRTTVEVNGSNIGGVTVVVDPGVDLKGHLFVDGISTGGALRISLVPDSNSVNVNDGQMTQVYGQIAQYEPAVGSDGGFVFPLLPEGPYRFRTLLEPTALPARGQSAGTMPAAPLPETAYVSDIRQGAISVYERGVVIGRSTPNPIDVFVNTNGGKIEGTVNSAGKPASGMIVVLVPPPDHRSNAEFYQTVVSDAAGHFSISRIPPGQYTLFASKSIQLGDLENSKVFEKYAKYGSAVSISSGALATVELKTIPNE